VLHLGIGEQRVEPKVLLVQCREGLACLVALDEEEGEQEEKEDDDDEQEEEKEKEKEKENAEKESDVIKDLKRQTNLRSRGG